MSKKQQNGGNQGKTGSSEDYKVGYAKPPKTTQFKPGNKCGKGRPKGSKNLSTIVNEAFGAKVSIKVNGKTRKVTKIEVALHQLANKAGGGDVRASAMAIALYQQYGPQEPIGKVSDDEAAYDLETIVHHLRVTGGLAGSAVNEEHGDD